MAAQYNAPLRSGKHTMMAGFIYYKWVLGSMCFWLNVVGDDTYSLYTKLGGRTSLFLTSQRMPSRYNAYINIYNFIFILTPPVAATSFFIHRTEIFDFVVR